MSKEDSGGYAFSSTVNDGMSVRQYYVAKLMQAELSKMPLHEIHDSTIVAVFKLVDRILKFEREEK